MSAKKDNLVNIGGWLAVNDYDLFDQLRNMVVIYEGLHTYLFSAPLRQGLGDLLDWYTIYPGGGICQSRVVLNTTQLW
jgi:hypothetical protein